MSDPQPLSVDELHTLGTYNAERYRGILHTPAWQAQMADLQRRFDETHQPGGWPMPRRRLRPLWRAKTP